MVAFPVLLWPRRVSVANLKSPALFQARKSITISLLYYYVLGERN